MSDWKAPLTRKGKPCTRCHPGRLCGYHQASSKIRTGNGGPTPKLTRLVLDAVSKAAIDAPGHEALWTAAGVHPATWFRWLDQGKKDMAENVVTAERELCESVLNHRRLLANSLAGDAVRAARGVYRAITDPKTGEVKRVYQEPPDAKVLMQLAARLDRDVLPPEHVALEHMGEGGGPIEVRMIDVKQRPKPSPGDLQDDEDDDAPAKR